VSSIGAALRQTLRSHSDGFGGQAVSHVVVTLTPIRAGHASLLGRKLRGLRGGHSSPLAHLRYVQFGRWMVIDQLKTDWPGTPRPNPELKSEYLLFSAVVTVPADDRDYTFPDSFWEDVRTLIPCVADVVWGHCMGYPGTAGPADFKRYFADSRLRTGIHHFGYEGAEVDDIRRALQVRDRFVAFALDHQHDLGADLKAAYLRESAGWFS
jgi:hypothetical protein